MHSSIAEILNTVDPQDRETLVNKALAQIVKSSLFALCKTICDFMDLTHATHGDVIRVLESQSLRKMHVLPRGSLKSSIVCVAYPIWILTNNPNARIFIDSQLFTNSSTFLREIRGHLEGPRLTDLFGEFKGSVWNDSEIIIRQRTKNFKEASITVGGVGTTKVGQHYDYIIHDDMNSPENSNTPEKAQKVIDHYKMNTSILEPSGTMVVVGTRYADNDLIGHILANEETDFKGIL